MIDCPRGIWGWMEKLGPRRRSSWTCGTGRGHGADAFQDPRTGAARVPVGVLDGHAGDGIMHHRFFDYGPWAGPLQGRSRGVLVRPGGGGGGYALFNLQERGTMFVRPGDPVYEGMVVGENARVGDMDVNRPRKEAHEHADDRVGRDDHPGAAAASDARAGARVHRGRRADRGHAVVHQAAQARARRHGASEAGAERAVGRGVVAGVGESDSSFKQQPQP